MSRTLTDHLKLYRDPEGRVFVNAGDLASWLRAVAAAAADMAAETGIADYGAMGRIIASEADALACRAITCAGEG